jgi:hypothetical protein
MTRIFNYYLDEGYDIEVDGNGGIPIIKVSKNNRYIKCMIEPKFLTNTELFAKIFESLVNQLVTKGEKENE